MPCRVSPFSVRSSRVPLWMRSKPRGLEDSPSGLARVCRSCTVSRVGKLSQGAAKKSHASASATQFPPPTRVEWSVGRGAMHFISRRDSTFVSASTRCGARGGWAVSGRIDGVWTPAGPSRVCTFDRRGPAPFRTARTSLPLLEILWERPRPLSVPRRQSRRSPVVCIRPTPRCAPTRLATPGGNHLGSPSPSRCSNGST